jgi:hypothetical protein
VTASTGVKTRQYVVVLTIIAVTSAVAWWATAQSWALAQESLLGEAEGSLAQAVARRRLEATTLAPAAAAMVIVGFAGLAGVIGSRGVIRRVIGMLIVLAGAVLVWSGLHAAVSLRVGDVVASGEVVAVSLVYPIVMACAGAAMAAAGVGVVMFAHRWPYLGAKYERTSDRPRDAWEAMDRGLDPTQD